MNREVPSGESRLRGATAIIQVRWTLPTASPGSRLLASALAVARSWRYAGGKRDQRLDLLRGFAAFAMIVDHIGGEDSWFFLLTGGNRFFTSAAEAFVFLSGLVMGMVYAPLIAREGVGGALRKSLRRAWTLYVLTVMLTLSFAALSSLLHVWWAPSLTRAELPQFVAGVLTLHRTFFLTDIPLLYTFLVLAGGPILALLAHGKTLPVLAGSWALWALWQVWPQAAQVPWPVAENFVFNLAAWQVLFITALVIGYHRQYITMRLGRIAMGYVLLMPGIVVAAAIAFYLTQTTDSGLLSAGGFLSHQLFEKADLPAGRLLVFAPVAAFSFALLTLAWVPIRRALGWLLLPLGEEALLAYSLHIFLVALTTVFTTTVLAGDSGGTATAMSLQTGGVLLTWGIIKAKPALGARVRLVLAAMTVPWQPRNVLLFGRRRSETSTAQVWREAA